ncbi:hypothetical protein BD309DRAFT_878755, partial [Dichomitus squalens]
SATASTPLGTMEVVVQDITAPIGSLAPRSRLSVLAVVTLGESTEVYTDTVCCENNSFGERHDR